MRPLFQYAICILAVLVVQAVGAIRVHQEFTVDTLSEFSAAVVGKVTEDSSRGILAKESGFSVWVSLIRPGIYRVTFTTRFETRELYSENAVSHQSISFRTVENATIAGSLAAEHEDRLNDALNKNGQFDVTNTITKDGQDGGTIGSIQKVECEIVSKEEVIRLIDVFFSGFPGKTILWEDNA